MRDPRYARGPGPDYDYRATQLPPARAARRRAYIARIRADLAERGHPPEPRCAREGCGCRRDGHYKRLDGTRGRCLRCEACEWWEEGRDEGTPGARVESEMRTASTGEERAW